MCCLAQFISIGGTNIYTIVVNSTLVFLFLSFIIPIVLGMVAFGTAKWPKAGPWSLGAGLYKLVSLLADCWHGHHFLHRHTSAK